MSSRFFTASDSSSEESSEEELYSDEEESQEESSSEEESDEEESGDESESDGSVTGAAKFLRDVSSDEESDDEERVKSLKSAKDKRFEELEGTIKQMENALKINDWQVANTGEFTCGILLDSLQLFTVAGQVVISDMETDDDTQNTTSSTA